MGTELNEVKLITSEPFISSQHHIVLFSDSLVEDYVPRTYNAEENSCPMHTMDMRQIFQLVENHSKIVADSICLAALVN